ncbi:MAG: hypothetical protein M0C28_27645 [Candidatus Moduliflexus flocculans]|nr:hypothetical protein [Candidatus Moduliflexus flocculans]
MLYIASRPIGLWFKTRSTGSGRQRPVGSGIPHHPLPGRPHMSSHGEEANWAGALKENPWLLTLVLVHAPERRLVRHPRHISRSG